jgi:undecaprenyl-diphosphatase
VTPTQGSRKGRLRNAIARVKPRDRSELFILLGGLLLVVLAWVFIALAGEVLEGDTQKFDERMLEALRRPDNRAIPIGPAWLQNAALDITALGSPTVLGLAVLAIVGFLLLQQSYRAAAFVFVASCGGWLLNSLLKTAFSRTRPTVVPHLREVMSQSFPSGHALTSAAVYLTLGALLMRLAKRRLTKFYCITIAMLATFLVGASRVYLGVHYPTDVLAGWLIGLSWALLCWLVERTLEKGAGWKRERAEAK